MEPDKVLGYIPMRIVHATKANLTMISLTETEKKNIQTGTNTWANLKTDSGMDLVLTNGLMVKLFLVCGN